MQYNDFEKNSIEKWVAGDTETYTYVDGIKVTEQELIEIGKTHDTAWLRSHTSVKVYAWLISNGTNFAWLDTFEEFCEFCCEHRIKSVWWYNAKFDFAQMDYILLKTGWTETQGRHGVHKSYNSLHDDFGQRYSLKLNYAYKGKGRNSTNRTLTVHTFVNYDFCNIIKGGLAKCLIDFNVTDFEGNAIRKLEMDYQGENTADNEQAIAYMKNDVIGLYHLVRIGSQYLEEVTGYSLTNGKPDIITAGGLAKRVLLDHLYVQFDKRNNIKKYQRLHKIDEGIDKCLRDKHLYRGGITVVNKWKVSKVIKQNIYRFDINSMYPAQMATMYDLVDRPKSMTPQEFKQLKNKDKYEVIYEIDSLIGKLKPNMIGVWYDFDKLEYVDDPFWTEGQQSFFIFEREMNELKNWYDFEYHIKRYIIVKRVKNKKYKEFVEEYYKLKAQSKLQKKPVVTAFAKLILNSSYGKLAENGEKIKSHRELDEQLDYVHLVKDETEFDANSIMSVLQGALITAMARVSLLSYIRKICGNVKENFLYCDTDSVHSLTNFDDTDDYELGKMKLEAVALSGKFIAPKTYIEEVAPLEYEIHSKGVPTKVIAPFVNGKTIEEVDKIFRSGAKFICLSGMNVKGGKALIPVPKFLCRPDSIVCYNDNGEVELVQDEKEKIFE